MPDRFCHNPTLLPNRNKISHHRTLIFSLLGYDAVTEISKSSMFMHLIGVSQPCHNRLDLSQLRVVTRTLIQARNDDSITTNTSLLVSDKSKGTPQ